ncbi:MAG: hypothetical protein FJ109_02190 [Deltaproteobacteria bacterium]|nr:hypothetical protein [Deltaproteobacteria bacterium]
MMKRFLVLLVLGLGFGCSHGEESECSKYVSLLGGTDPKAVFKDIAEKKCQDAIPILKDMFDPRQGKYNKDIMRIISQTWEPSVVNFKTEAEKFPKKKPLYFEILRLALQSPETAMLAATSIEEWKLIDLKPDLVKMLTDDVKSAQPQFALAYAPALRVLASDEMGGLNDDLEEVLIALANNSPDVQGIEVNKRASEGLGKLKTKNPEGIKALVRGLFLVSKDGGTTFKESLKSLLQIGSASAPFLVDVMESRPGDEKVRYMEEFAVKNAISEWKWRKGMRVPMLLAQLRDPRAAGALVRDIARPVIEPANLPDSLKLDWTIEMTNRIKFDSWGIMSIMTADEMLGALKIIRDRNVEGSARLQLALGLAFNFTPEAMDVLLRVCYEAVSDVEDEEPDAAKVKAADAGEPAKEADFVIRFLQPLAFGLDVGHLVQFNDIFVEGFDENFGDVEKSEDIQERLDQIDVKVLLAVSNACKEDLTCLQTVLQGGQGKLEGSEVVYDPDTVKGVDDRETEYVKGMARAKAALTLGRLKLKKEERAELLKLFAKVYAALDYDDELYGDLRQVILLGFERQGMADTAAALSVLKDLMAAEEKKGIDPVKVWNQRLEALVFFLEAYK